MASHSLAPVLGVSSSLSGRAWHWRGGNMALDTGIGGPDQDILTQLLLARGVAPDDLARNIAPSFREFLPDPSAFLDMDLAAERLAQAILGGEKITIYGDYDVDGATSEALLIYLLRQLDAVAEYYIPNRLLEG